MGSGTVYRCAHNDSRTAPEIVHVCSEAARGIVHIRASKRNAHATACADKGLPTEPDGLSIMLGQLIAVYRSVRWWDSSWTFAQTCACGGIALGILQNVRMADQQP